jgi:hypothetical protein
MGYGAQQMGMAQQLGSQAIGPRAVDYNAGLNLAMQNASNLGSYNTAIYGSQAQVAGANAQARGAIIGGAFQGLGALGAAGIAKCWVAREIYGENNPKWMLFREWLNNHAPKWFDSLYIKHGEKFAVWIANKPLLKSVIRKWMDSRIAVLVSTKGLSYA